MAIASATSFPIRIDGELIRFGFHYLPINTARSFWIYTNKDNFGFSGPMLQLTLGSFAHPRNYLVYQMRAETIEKVKELALVLLTKSRAKLVANFKDIKPQVIQTGKEYRGLIEFEFWDADKNDHFNILVGSPLLSKEGIEVIQKGPQTLLRLKPTDTEQGQIEQMKATLTRISQLTSGGEVQLILLKKLDAKFSMGPQLQREPEIDVCQIPYINRLMNPGFVITPAKLYRICISKMNLITNELLFVAAPIFQFVGERLRKKQENF